MYLWYPSWDEMENTSYQMNTPECLWCDLFFPLIQCSFMLLISSSLLCHFSVYAMSRHNRSGIIVCSLPYGVLIATYSFPCTSVKAIEIVENTCEQLRRWHIMLKCAFKVFRVYKQEIMAEPESGIVKPVSGINFTHLIYYYHHYCHCQQCCLCCCHQHYHYQTMCMYFR